MQWNANGQGSTGLGFTSSGRIIDGSGEVIIGGDGVSRLYYPTDYTGGDAVTASAKNQYLCRLAAAGQIDLPASPSDGDYVEIVDVLGNFSTYALTVSGNGNNIKGLGGDDPSEIHGDDFRTATYVYSALAGYWVVTNLT